MVHVPAAPARALRMALLALTVTLLPGCEGEPAGPSRDFMIHLPADNPGSVAVATFTAAPTSSGAINFAWDPARGAERYEIAFWRAQSRDSMNVFNADLGRTPDLIIAVDHPQVQSKPVNTGFPDGAQLPLVVHAAALRDVDAVLEAAGFAAGGQYFFVWSVYAIGPGGRVRSPERHRMVLQR